MESNQELMILSLLNLYVSYVDLKNRNAEEQPFYNRYATQRLQRYRALNEEQRNIVANKTISGATKATIFKQQKASVSTTDPKISDSNIAVITDEEKEQSFDNYRADTRSVSSTDSDTYNEIIADLTESTAEIKKLKPLVKTRNRGEPKRSKKGKFSDKIPRKRRWRVRPINRDRAIAGFHRKVFTNIKKLDQQQFFEHTRMSKSLFDWLLTFVHTALRKNKQSILPEERLAITLNYLAYGTSLQSIAWKHKVGKSTVRQIVLDTCSALWTLLSPIYFSEPTTSQYADIAEDFRCKWDIPNCVGAIDGKHVSIRLPSRKDPSSLLLLGACDTKYKFTAISVGNFNNQSDEGIFQLSSSNVATVSDKLPLPSNKPLFPSSLPLPHFFISNTTFPLRKNIMCPYSGENLDAAKTIFNFKISRACRVTENTFGILTARFRVLLTTIEFLADSCKTIILACVVLHNLIITNDEEQLYCPANFADRENLSGIIDEGEWRNELKNNGDQPLPSIISNSSRSTFEAINIRNTLANFFASEAINYEIELL